MMNMKLKILVSPDKYKGSLSAVEVCDIIKKSILEVDSSVDVIVNPIADGGEGTVSTLVDGYDGRYVSLKVTGPLGEPVKARFGIIGDSTAVIEMASASGLVLVPPEKRNPMETTTYGTGELIKKALDMGCKKIIAGIGGSATNDGGLGMAGALGYKFYDKKGRKLGPEGRELINLYRIDVSDVNPLILSCEFEVAVDVMNPLTGKDGAAYVYGPQKGADSKMVRELDRGLENFAEVVKKELGKDVRKIKGSGAAGGLGAGMFAFLNAKIKNGIDVIIEATGLEDKIKNSDLVITGEGALDMQTFFGKGVCGIGRLAKKYNKPVITINGSVLINRNELNRSSRSLTSGNFSIINRPMSLEQAVNDAKELLKGQTKELILFYLTALRKNR